MGIFTETLHRQFRADLGISPKTFLTRHLLHRATRELLYGSRTVKEIAAELGFTSVAYFSRFVSKHTGHSPTAHRARAREA